MFLTRDSMAFGRWRLRGSFAWLSPDLWHPKPRSDPLLITDDPGLSLVPMHSRISHVVTSSARCASWPAQGDSRLVWRCVFPGVHPHRDRLTRPVRCGLRPAVCRPHPRPVGAGRRRIREPERLGARCGVGASARRTPQGFPAPSSRGRTRPRVRHTEAPRTRSLIAHPPHPSPHT